MATRSIANVVTSAGSMWDRCGGREVAVDQASSSWYVQVPTLAGGIVAHVRADHVTGAHWVACSDDRGVWYRSFEGPDDLASWLDYIRSGDLVVVRSDAMPDEHRVATFKPRVAA